MRSVAMKIIDKFKDYWDYAGLGIDESIVLDRKYLYAHVNCDEPISGLPASIYIPILYSQYECGTLSIDFIYVLVGGMGIPCIEVKEDRGTTTYHYDDQDAIGVIEEAIKSLDIEKDIFIKGGMKIIKTQINDFFEKGRRDLTDICATAKIVTGSVRMQQESLSYVAMGKVREDVKAIYQHDLLINYNLQNVLPAHEAHMMVSRFVGGVMTQNDDILEISDISKIKKAGFDTKISFRKRKSA